MPARDFDYSGVRRNTKHFKKRARDQQLSENIDILFQSRKSNNQRSNLIFQTDRQEGWKDALLGFRKANPEVSFAACFESSGIIVVYGSEIDLNVFEAAFDGLRDSLGDDQRDNPGDDLAAGIEGIVLNNDEEDDAVEDEDPGEIIVANVEEIRPRGARGRRQTE